MTNLNTITNPPCRKRQFQAVRNLLTTNGLAYRYLRKLKALSPLGSPCSALFISGLISGLCLICLGSTTPLLAQDLIEANPAKGNISIVTKALSADQIPFPGQPLSLKASLKNTRDFRAPLRLLIVRDGVFQELQTGPGLPDSSDKPQYEISVPAPLAEIIYQFILTTPDGKIFSSDRIVSRRKCVPDTTAVSETIESDIEGEDRLRLLISENKRLENEIANLESVGKEFDAVSELLNR